MTGVNLSNATIIDVREPHECNFGMAKNAMNIPLNQVIHMVDEINAMPKPILLYCQSGNRSGHATLMLKARGVTEIYNAGGLSDILRVQNASSVAV